MRARLRAGAEVDAGFTLIEVVVALVLLGMVATGALYFFITGTRTTSHLQRSQNAVAVANEAMERAYAVNPKDNPVAGVPGLVLGRQKAAVEAAFTHAASLGVEGAADTYPLWDPSAGAGTQPTVPITYDRTYSGQRYDVTVLVGTCFRPRDVANPDQACTRLPGVVADPGDSGTPHGMVRMLRVVTLVEWDATAGECGGDRCTYQLAGLVDRSSDLEWNQVVEPVVVDDFATVEQGQSLVLNVLSNDVVGPVSSMPVFLVSQPAAGTATVAANGLVTYHAPTGASGIYTFQYRIKDARGAQSAPGDITVTVPPQSANDGTIPVFHGTSNVLDVLANDKGTHASVQITQQPSRGSVAVSGLEVRYTPTATSGLDTFRYTYTDASGQVSPEAQVTVSISTITVSDAVEAVVARPAGPETWTDLTAKLKGSHPAAAAAEVEIMDVAAGSGTFRANTTTFTSGTRKGATVAYSPPVGFVGEVTVRYRLVMPSGAASDPARLTIQVRPRAVNHTAGSYTRRQTVYVPVGTANVPNQYGSTVTIVPESVSSQCGTFVNGWQQDRLHQGEVRIQLPDVGAAGRSCTFTYRLQGTGAASHLWSDPATVSYRVVR